MPRLHDGIVFAQSTLGHPMMKFFRKHRRRPAKGLSVTSRVSLYARKSNQSQGTTKARSTIMDKHDVTHLERQIKELGGTLIRLANDSDFQEFITIIHKPGWTTVAEHLFVTGAVDSVLAPPKHL